jgi:superfamily II DNA or RNA helicase
MITLRPYQNELYLRLQSKINEGCKRILIQAETGWGKSILIGHTANNLEGRTLILTHRIELLTQNSEWINDVGILTAKIKKVEGLKKCKNIIAMTQTVSARFDKFGVDYLGSFDNIIVDETHVDFFKKVYNEIDYKLLIGLTATPIVYKTEKKTISEGEVMSRKLSLADDFDILIQGIGVNELIDLGYLTEDKYIALTPPNLSKLVKSASNPDGYTSSSLTEVFGSYASVKNVISSYQKRADTKTIIFNPTTKVNLKIYEAFIKEGYADRVKMFDSVNKDSSETRSDIVKWYKETPNAVLLNVGVFTTGFDVKDIDTIIYNKSTLSLSLWLQSCGRGGRIFKGKETFTIVDLGLNIERHGFWSDDRDWSQYFIVHKWEAKTPSDILQVWECKSCGAYNLKGTVFNTELSQFECGECNHPKEDSKSQVKHIKGELVEVKKVRYPSSKSIINYATVNGNDANLAFRLLEKKIIALFVNYTEKEHYLQNRNRYLNRMGDLYRPVYFAILRSKLKGANKKLRTQTDKIIKKLDKYYGEKA